MLIWVNERATLAQNVHSWNTGCAMKPGADCRQLKPAMRSRSKKPTAEEDGGGGRRGRIAACVDVGDAWAEGIQTEAGHARSRLYHAERGT